MRFGQHLKAANQQILKLVCFNISLVTYSLAKTLLNNDNKYNYINYPVPEDMYALNLNNAVTYHLEILFCIRTFLVFVFKVEQTNKCV